MGKWGTCLFFIWGWYYLYPPKGTAKAVTDSVHFTVFSFYMWLANQNGCSKIPYYICLFESLENLYCPDGWMGGDQKGPSIFLIFKYNINKKNMLKIVYEFFKRSYNHFKFQNLTSQLKIKRIFNGICGFFWIFKAN